MYQAVVEWEAYVDRVGSSRHVIQSVKTFGLFSSRTNWSGAFIGAILIGRRLSLLLLATALSFSAQGNKNTLRRPIDLGFDKKKEEPLPLPRALERIGLLTIPSCQQRFPRSKAGPVLRKIGRQRRRIPKRPTSDPASLPGRATWIPRPIWRLLSVLRSKCLEPFTRALLSSGRRNYLVSRIPGETKFQKAKSSLTF